MILAAKTPVDEERCKELEWSRARTHLVCLMCHLAPRMPLASASVEEKGKWLLECGGRVWPVVVRLAYDLVGEDYAKLLCSMPEMQRLAKRLFIKPLVRGDELMTAWSLKSVEIGPALTQIKLWQLTAPESILRKGKWAKKDVLRLAREYYQRSIIESLH